MASSLASQRVSQVPGEERLADVLARGGLKLTARLHCLVEVARLLQEMHKNDGTHGEVTAANVLLRGSQVELLPPKNRRELRGQREDICEFGALLYEAVTGNPIGQDVSPDAFLQTAMAVDASAGDAPVQTAAVQLAGKCMGYLSPAPAMRQVVTQLRVFWLMARQSESGQALEPPKGAPFLVKPALPAPVFPESILAPAESEADPQPSPEQGTPGATVPPEPAPQKAETPAKTVASGREPAGVQCPNCQSSNTYVSHPRTWFEESMVAIGSSIIGCHGCYHRHMLVAGMRFEKELPAKRGKK